MPNTNLSQEHGSYPASIYGMHSTAPGRTAETYTIENREPGRCGGELPYHLHWRGKVRGPQIKFSLGNYSGSPASSTSLDLASLRR